jgi:GT2 family glycosyltransferase
MPDLSIVIVSFRGAERLSLCLSSLRAINEGAVSREVIIVNNSPGDEGIAALKDRFPQFLFSDNSVNGGFGHGCNLGARLSTGDSILFLNPDTIVADDVPAHLSLRAAEAEGSVIASCRQVRRDGTVSIAWGEFPRPGNLTGLQRAAGRLTGTRKSRATGGDGNCFYPDWISGSVMLISRKDFEMIGGFDEDFWMYYEDVDLCCRVAGRGGRMVFYNDITVEHNHGGSSRASMKITSLTKTEVMISRHVYISKHMRGIEKIMIQSFLVINNLLSGLIMALAGLLLPFLPKVYVRFLIYVRLLSYYSGALRHLTWVSPRAAGRIKSKLFTDIV